MQAAAGKSVKFYAILLIAFSIMPYSYASYYDSEKIMVFEGRASFKTNSEATLKHIKPVGEYTVDEIIHDEWRLGAGAEIISGCYLEQPCLFLAPDPDVSHISSASQTFFLDSSSPSTLKMSLKTSGNEKLSGFDSPYFIIKIDEKIIYEEHYSTEVPLNSWREVGITLPLLNPGFHQLQLVQQNTGDNLFPLQVLIAGITSKYAYLGIADSVEITPNTAVNQVNAILHKSTENVEIHNLPEIVFQPGQLWDAFRIEYWEGNNPEHKIVEINADLEIPNSPKIILHQLENNGTHTLKIEKDSDVQFIDLELDCQSNPTYLLLTAKTFLQREIIWVNDDISNCTYLNLRSFDRAGNISRITSLQL